MTSLRLLLSVVLFGLISAEHYIAAFVLFLVAVGTDWLDGYYARKYNQITTLGRILDPFADKVIICGTFIFLVTTRGCLPIGCLLQAWMVVVIVGRELLVTALRSFLEERGSDFSANLSGKLKMVLQCVAAGPRWSISITRRSVTRPARSDRAAVDLLVYGRFHLVGGDPHGLLRGDLRLDRLQASQADNRRLGRMTPLLATSPGEGMLQAAILAVLLAVSAGIWTWIYTRWQQGEPIMPLARRRPVPWQAQDVLFVFLIALLLLHAAVRAVQAWMGPDAGSRRPIKSPNWPIRPNNCSRSGIPARTPLPL